MRPLQRPAVTSAEVLAACLKAVDDTSLKKRFASANLELEAAAKNYSLHATNETLYLVPRVDSVGSITKDELVSLYSDYFPYGEARQFYNKIRGAAPSQKCPLCGVGTVAVLDHHLPKRKYPNLSIVPDNLVPACHFCNHKKASRFPKNAGEQTLHPYFDARLMTAPWLKATLVRGSPPVITFSAAPPADWPLVDRRRVERHFNVCGLDIVFASNANDELSPLKENLSLVHPFGGDSAVRAHLVDRAASYSSRPNSWQFAMYEELASHPWFVSGGFVQIA